MKGRLSLRVGVRHGRSAIVEGRCEFPLQVLRPRVSGPGEGLSLTVLTPSGGLLSGDELEGEVVLEAGARLTLCTQAASQVHAGRSSQRWHFDLADDASLAYVPRMLVPHARARHHSRVSACLAGGARLLCSEAVAPGRLHQAEAFAYEELRLDLDVRQEARLVARERQLLRPACAPLTGIFGCYTHTASVYALGPGSAAVTAPTVVPALDGLQAGHSALASGGHCMRLLAHRAFDIECAVAQLLRAWGP